MSITKLEHQYYQEDGGGYTIAGLLGHLSQLKEITRATPAEADVDDIINELLENYRKSLYVKCIKEYHLAGGEFEDATLNDESIKILEDIFCYGVNLKSGVIRNNDSDTLPDLAYPDFGLATMMQGNDNDRALFLNNRGVIKNGADLNNSLKDHLGNQFYSKEMLWEELATWYLTVVKNKKTHQIICERFNALKGVDIAPSRLRRGDIRDISGGFPVNGATMQDFQFCVLVLLRENGSDKLDLNLDLQLDAQEEYSHLQLKKAQKAMRDERYSERFKSTIYNGSALPCLHRSEKLLLKSINTFKQKEERDNTDKVAPQVQARVLSRLNALLKRKKNKKSVVKYPAHLGAIKSIINTISNDIEIKGYFELRKQYDLFEKVCDDVLLKLKTRSDYLGTHLIGKGAAGRGYEEGISAYIALSETTQSIKQQYPRDIEHQPQNGSRGLIALKVALNNEFTKMRPEKTRKRYQDYWSYLKKCNEQVDKALKKTTLGGFYVRAFNSLEKVVPLLRRVCEKKIFGKSMTSQYVQANAPALLNKVLDYLYELKQMDVTSHENNPVVLMRELFEGLQMLKDEGITSDIHYNTALENLYQSTQKLLTLPIARDYEKKFIQRHFFYTGAHGLTQDEHDDDSSDDTATDSTVFPGHRLKGKKTGGANDAGSYGGIYKVTKLDGNITCKSNIGRISLIKRESTIEKVIGEKLTGNWAKKTMGVIYSNYDDGTNLPVEDAMAQTDWIRSQKGDKKPTYVRSLFLPNYGGDLWKVAYADHYLDEYRQALASKPLDEAQVRAIKQEAINLYEDEIKKLSNKKNLNENEREQCHSLNLQLAELLQINNHIAPIPLFFQTNNESRLKTLIKLKMNCMKRPSAARIWVIGNIERFTEPRKIVSAYIRRSPRLHKQLCQQAATRLFISDPGLHFANFGAFYKSIHDDLRLEKRAGQWMAVSKRNNRVVIQLEEAKDKDGNPVLIGMEHPNKRILAELHIGSFDYGAGCLALCDKKFNPFETDGVGYKGMEKYKNHILEFHEDIIFSPEMARACLNIGMMTDHQLNQIVEFPFNGQDITAFFTRYELKQLCKRMGIKETPDPEKIEDFISIQEIQDFYTRTSKSLEPFTNLLDADVRNSYQLAAFLEKKTKEAFCERRNKMQTIGFRLFFEDCIYRDNSSGNWEIRPATISGLLEQLSVKEQRAFAVFCERKIRTMRFKLHDINRFDSRTKAHLKKEVVPIIGQSNIFVYQDEDRRGTAVYDDKGRQIAGDYLPNADFNPDHTYGYDTRLTDRENFKDRNLLTARNALYDILSNEAFWGSKTRLGNRPTYAQEMLDVIENRPLFGPQGQIEKLIRIAGRANDAGFLFFTKHDLGRHNTTAAFYRLVSRLDLEAIKHGDFSQIRSIQTMLNNADWRDHNADNGWADIFLTTDTFKVGNIAKLLDLIRNKTNGLDDADPYKVDLLCILNENTTSEEKLDTLINFAYINFNDKDHFTFHIYNIELDEIKTGNFLSAYKMMQHMNMTDEQIEKAGFGKTPVKKLLDIIRDETNALDDRDDQYKQLLLMCLNRPNMNNEEKLNELIKLSRNNCNEEYHFAYYICEIITDDIKAGDFSSAHKMMGYMNMIDEQIEKAGFGEAGYSSSSSSLFLS